VNRQTTLNVTQLNAKSSMLAGVAAGIGASVCCVGPLVLLALGISGTWIGVLTALEPYRPFFIGLTLLFLGLAFRKLDLGRRFVRPVQHARTIPAYSGVSA
jgi:mercuric ion transport protein